MQNVACVRFTVEKLHEQEKRDFITAFENLF